LNKEERIREFIVGSLGWRGDRKALTRDYPLIEQDVLDSLGIFEMVTFLESDFGLELADDDLVSENFANIGAIVELIEKRS
jgi:acyl carrier protein